MGEQHNSAKLHAIYEALDTHNYIYAVKLTQHKSICNWKITMALRCIALRRVGRKEDCIVLLKNNLLGYLRVSNPENDEMGDLLYRVRRQRAYWNLPQLSTSGGNKNSGNSGESGSNPNHDILRDEEYPFEKLDSPLMRTIVDAKMEPSSTDIIVDETTLATIALTLNAFELNQTLIHMYTLASSKNQNLHQDLYFSNLRILMDPKYDNFSSSMTFFENMQSSAMILARSNMKCFMWTSVTALWRLQEMAKLEEQQQKQQQQQQQETNESDSRMKAMLPRLAESLASRVIGDRQTATIDDWKVYIQTMIIQKKYKEAMDVLLDYSPPSDAEREQVRKTIHQMQDEGSGVPPYMTTKARLELLASLAKEAHVYEKGVKWYGELLEDFVDDWSYGSSMLKCACEMDNQLASETSSNPTRFVNLDSCHTMLHDLQVKMDAQKPMRGPFLLAIETVALKLSTGDDDDDDDVEQTGDKKDHCNALKQSIIQYVEIFGGLASCCFADIRPYLTILLDKVNDKKSVAEELIQLCQESIEKNKVIEDAVDMIDKSEYSERKKKLRKYIVASQISLEVWCKAKEKYGIVLDRNLLPDVGCMMKQWELSLSQYKEFSTGDGNRTQKEVLPGDDLILLSAFTILEYHLEQSSNPNLIINVAALLEHGLEQSPHNPQLILFLLYLYSSQILNASTRSYSLFRMLDIKQIQHDSLTYLILPIALTSGLYNQGAEHCADVLGIHRSSATDVAEYAKKSMMNGFYEVVEDMLNFQRYKMRHSVQLLEAKGIIMDFAPLRVPPLKSRKGDVKCLGIKHGLVGGPDDELRALQMVDDGNDYFGAPSIIRFVGNDLTVNSDHLEGLYSKFEDNRDFSVWNFVIGSETIYDENVRRSSFKKIIVDSIERGHIHAILVRAVLIINFAKPIKKKKKKKKKDGSNTNIANVPDAVKNRCNSLKNALNKARAFSPSNSFWKIMDGLCTIITSVCANEPQIEIDDSKIGENSITKILRKVVNDLVSLRKEYVPIETQAASNDPIGQRAGNIGAICSFLPSKLVPIFTLLECVRKLFILQGWTKKAQSRKEVSDLAALMSELIALLTDCKEILSEEMNTKQTNEVINSLTEFVTCSDQIKGVEFFNSPLGKKRVQDSLQHVMESHNDSQQNVLTFLTEMIEQTEKTLTDEFSL